MTIRLGSLTEGPPNRYDLLGGWRDVVERVRQLSLQLRSASGVCACGHTSSSDGRCPCCHDGTPHTDCPECATQVNAFAETIDLLVDDTLRFLPVVRSVLERRAAAIELKLLTSIRSQILTVEYTFRRFATASAGFERGCRSSHTRALEATADDLLRETWELERLLEPAVRRWAELDRK